MAVANVELNILASDPQANDLGSLVQGGVSLLVTDDTRSFELRASQGFVSFLYVGADWGKVKESLRSTLGKFASKPNAVIYADDSTY